MGFPFFDPNNGKLLFCNGSLASACCTPSTDPLILTITLSLVDNSGVYNQVSFSFGGATWGNQCSAGAPPAGVTAGDWVSSFDLSVLGPTLSVSILADCHYFHTGDAVGHVAISAVLTQEGVTVDSASGTLTPAPVYEDSSATHTPGCAGSGAASAAVRVSNNTITIS